MHILEESAKEYTRSAGYPRKESNGKLHIHRHLIDNTTVPNLQ